MKIWIEFYGVKFKLGFVLTAVLELLCGLKVRVGSMMGFKVEGLGLKLGLSLEIWDQCWI